MNTDEKIRENRMRRMAHRQGLALVKSKRRDPRAVGYGGYLLVDERNVVVAGDPKHGADLDQIEKALLG
jgi:hypothetical protein